MKPSGSAVRLRWHTLEKPNVFYTNAIVDSTKLPKFCNCFFLIKSSNECFGFCVSLTTIHLLLSKLCAFGKEIAEGLVCWFVVCCGTVHLVQQGRSGQSSLEEQATPHRR